METDQTIYSNYLNKQTNINLFLIQLLSFSYSITCFSTFSLPGLSGIGLVSSPGSKIFNEAGGRIDGLKEYSENDVKSHDRIR